jgi:hypothetical protein
MAVTSCLAYILIATKPAEAPVATELLVLPRFGSSRPSTRVLPHSRGQLVWITVSSGTLSASRGTDMSVVKKKPET